MFGVYRFVSQPVSQAVMSASSMLAQVNDGRRRGDKINSKRPVTAKFDGSMSAMSDPLAGTAKY